MNTSLKCHIEIEQCNSLELTSCMGRIYENVLALLLEQLQQFVDKSYWPSKQNCITYQQIQRFFWYFVTYVLQMYLFLFAHQIMCINQHMNTISCNRSKNNCSEEPNHVTCVMLFMDDYYEALKRKISFENYQRC